MTGFLSIFFFSLFLSFFCVRAAPVFARATEIDFDFINESSYGQVPLERDDTKPSEKSSSRVTPTLMTRTTTDSHQFPIQLPQYRRHYAPDRYPIPQAGEHVRRRTDSAGAIAISSAVSESSKSKLSTQVQVEEPKGAEGTEIQLNIAAGGNDLPNIASASVSEAPTSASVQAGPNSSAGNSLSSPSFVADIGTSESDGTSSTLDTADSYIETLTSSLELLKALHAFSFLAHIAHATHALVSLRTRKASCKHDPEVKSKAVSESDTPNEKVRPTLSRD